MKLKFLLFLFTPFLLTAQNVPENNGEGLVKWLNFKQAQELNKQVQKPFIIDIYTDWCGWCKHMMKTTYSNAALANYINANFYPVKFDAETKDTIEYQGKKYYPTSTAPKTPHQLTIKFLGSSLSYPSTIFSGNNLEFNLLTQGFLDDKKIEPLLVYMVENVFRTTVYDDFSERFSKTFYDTVFAKKPVKTYSVKEALALQKTKPKKMLVNIYTGFCNSCRIMNKTTYVDTSVASYINKNFYLVNFDAESNDTIVFKNEKFFKQLLNGYPFNTFVMKATNNKFSLPALAILDEQSNNLDVINYYLHPKNLKPVLIFYGGNHYKTKKWPDFYAAYSSKKK